MKGGEEKEKLEELMKDIGVEINMEDIKRIRGRTGGKEMWWLRLESEEQKRKKSGLKGRKERIGNDLTVMKRKMKWKLEEVAKEQERQVKRIWIGYGKIKIEGEWWF